MVPSPQLNNIGKLSLTKLNFNGEFIMEVDYICCSSCGYEDFNVYVAYSRQTADGDHWFCPKCNKEISDVDTGREED